MIIRSKYILSSALIMKMVVFGIFAADGTVLADEGVTITCPSDYPNIDSNATSENDCWRECTTADVAGSVSVSGRNYYGTGTDTCEPTECMAGWFIQPALNLKETVGTDYATNSTSINNNGDIEDSENKGMDYYGIFDKNSFAVEYTDKGILTGHGRCSTQAGVHNYDSNEITTWGTLTDETGQEGAIYCYCNVTSFTPTGGSEVIVTSAPWLFNFDGDSADECADSCAHFCNYNLKSSGSFRTTMFDMLGVLPAACKEIAYTLKVGKYLPADGNIPVNCPSGYYCPGGAFVRWDEKNDQGLVLCPSDYPNSDTGATSENECYRKCTTDDVAGVQAVMGNNYYGAGVDTCEEARYFIGVGEYLPAGGEEPLNCPSGYYCPGVGVVKYDPDKDQGIKVCPNEYPNSDIGSDEEIDCYKPCKTEDVPGAIGEVYGKDYYGNRLDSCKATQCMAGWYIKQEENLWDEVFSVNSSKAYNSAFIDNNGNYSDLLNNRSQEYYGITDNMSFAVDYGSSRGMMFGHGRCSTQSGSNGSDWMGNVTKIMMVDGLVDETGQDGAGYCYCKLDGYTSATGIEPTPWMYYKSYSAADCAVKCSRDCATVFYGVGAYTALAFKEVITSHEGVCSDEYVLDFGQYLPASGEGPTDCPVGYYCPGSSFVRYDDENDQGLVLCPSDYPNSDVGSDEEIDCYKPCKTEDVPGATGEVTGNNYYGSNGSTCEVTECMDGWYKKSRNLTEIIGDDTAENSAYVSNDGNFSEMNYDDKGRKGQEYYGISDKNSFAVDYAGKGMLTGHGRCSTQLGKGGNSPTIINELVDETGQSGAQYCYCQVDGFTTKDGNKVTFTLSPWVFEGTHTGWCASGCARECAYRLRGDSSYLAFRSAVFKATGIIGPDMCVENGTYLPDGATEPLGCPDEYPASDSNATDIAHCYRECKLEDVPGAKLVKGSVYYDNKANSCKASQCVAGWNLKDGLDLMSLTGTNSAVSYGRIDNNGNFNEYRRNYSNKYYGQTYYGMTDKNSFGAVFDGGSAEVLLRGHARCSTVNVDKLSEVLDETGVDGANYCYCKLDEYRISGGEDTPIPSALWMRYDSYSSADYCANHCAYYCAGGMYVQIYHENNFIENTYRLNMFEEIKTSSVSCEVVWYDIPAGQYLPMGTTEIVDCPSGYYCPGMKDVTYSAVANQGINKCPDGYDSSDVGSDAENDCYKPCTTDDVPGAMSVTGNNYYGSNGSTCEVTECMAGWELKPELNLAETIGEEVGPNRAYIKNDGSFSEFNQDGNGDKGQEYYGISGPMSFAVDYVGKGLLTGHGRCSTQAGVGIWNGASTPEEITVVNNLTDETGTEGAQYCYCQVDGFTPTGGTKEMVTSAPWVFCNNSGTVDNCASGCADVCADDLRLRAAVYLTFRAAVMNSLPLPRTCEEITYTLNPGEYLPAGGEEPVDCPSGYYCPGAGDVRYDEKNDQGLVLCPTDYPNSDAGAKSENDCYKPCTTDDVAGAMSVTGKNYYGNKANSCKASQCVAGWILKDGIDLSKFAGTNSAVSYAYVTDDGNFGEGTDSDYGKYYGQEYYGMTDKNSFGAVLSVLTVKGSARCSTVNVDKLSEVSNEMGIDGAEYCYCKLNEYSIYGGEYMPITSAPWMRVGSHSSADDCVSDCARDCAHGLSRQVYEDGYLVNKFRFNMLEEIKNSSWFCEEKVTCPSDYPNMDGQLNDINKCYRECTTDDVANSMSVVGKNYYGAGADTCAVTECMAGWELKPWLNLAETIGEEKGANNAYITNAGSFDEDDFGGGIKGQEYYGISDKYSFAVDYAGKGILTGHGRCSTQAGTNNNYTWTDPTIVNTLTDETGQSGAGYCYCQVDGFTPTGGTKAIVTSAPWVFYSDFGSADLCADNCAYNCAYNLQFVDVNDLAFRAAVMNNLPALPATCEEITYTLNPGEYLPAGGEEPVDCPNGSYCPGGETVYWNKDEDQGIKVCPSDYPNSDAGAKSENDCYRPCKAEEIGAVGEVSGNNYYGSAGRTCAVTECADGWRMGGISDVIGTNQADKRGVMYPDYFSEDVWSGYYMDQDYYGISEVNSFAVDYGYNGMVKGRGICSTKQGEFNYDWGTNTLLNVTTFDELDDETGNYDAQYCYCQVNEYVSSGGGLSQSVSGKWVFNPNYYSSDDCRYYCGSYCADMMVWADPYQLSFRDAVLGGDENYCTEILYKIPAGQYIVAGSTEPTKCPSGYYCPGMGDVRLSDDKDQGLITCPTGFPNSNKGAKSENDCYKPCKPGDLYGAIGISGNNYYGSKGTTCSVTECVAGWMVQDFADIIGKNSGTNSTYINNNGDITDSEKKGLAYYGISDKNSFAVEYGKRGILTGHGRCSTQAGVYNFDWNTYTLTDVTVIDSLADETGMDGAQYCYCQVDGFTPVGELTQMLSDQPWVYYRNLWDSGSCANDCARTCSNLLRDNGDEGMTMRQVLFGPSMCVQASYRLNAGTYLPAGEDTPTKCPVGYYCPGVVNVKTDEENDQGLFKCPVDYPDSDEGAMADTYCYTSCKLENMDAENIIAVTGKDYYGTGADTCVPSECAAGWIVQDLTGIAGQSYASNSAYITTNSGVVGLVDSNGRDMMYYGISELNSFALDFGKKGIITGRARCSSIEGTNDDYTWKNPTILDELADETGQEGAYHCYCQVDGFTMPNKVVQQVSGPWVYRSNKWGDYEYCANSCVGDCVQQLKYNGSDNMAFRKAMFVPTMCVQASYRINAGTYLPAGDDTPTKCPVGYYCPGVVNVKLDEENDQGLSQCPSGYPNSDAGAKADTQCYTQCTINDVANSMTVVGNNYYGTGTDTCEATECVPGWLLDLGLGEYAVCADTLSYIEPGTYLPAGNSVVEICLPGSYCPGADNISYNVDADQGIFACPTEYPNSYTGAKADTECYQTCKIDNGDVTTSGNGNIYYGDENNTCELTECADGWKLKDFAKKIGTENGINSAYVSTNSMSYGQFVEEEWINDSVMGQMYYGISKPGEFAVGFGENGVITGRGRCSTKSGVKNYDWGTQEYSEITTFDELDDESGNDDARYCYCQVDGYIPVAGLLTQVLSGMPWVFYDESWSGEGCDSYCAQNCVSIIRDNYTENIAFRAVAFGAKPEAPAICIEESYRLNPGMYLMAGEDTPTKCPSGSYCPGAGDVILNSDKNQGIVKCPSGYPYSDAGATDDTQCYSLCTTDDVANSTSVIGNDYYGDGTDTCAATQCVAGWKLRDLSAIIGTASGLNSACISTNSYSYGEFRDSAGLNQDYYGLSEPGEFAVDYGDTGIITGRARCSTKPGVGGTNPTVFKELDDESGVDGAQYCYCQVNGYFKQGELIQAISGPWVYHGSCSSDGTSMCEDSCGSYLKWNGTNELAFRSVMFGGATCEQTKYRLNAGTYLPAGDDVPTKCPVGYYCPGATDITIDKNKDQGIVKCPNDYPYSDAGVAANTQCYKDCTNEDVANAITVVGRNYYGDGKDTCKVTDCVAGWHLNPGLDLEDLIGSVYEGSNSEYMAGTNSAYISNTGDFVEYGQYEEYGQDYYGISENNSFAVVYDDDKGMITGRARCSSQSENSVENLPDESGNTDATNCYCNIDSYRSGDGIQQSVVAPWIKYGSINWYPGACESNCVQNCSVQMREHMTLDFRGKMFGTAYEMPSCEVETGASISYELGGGTNYEGAPTSYEYGVGAKIDGVPTRSSSVFISWCRDPELTDCAMSYEISPDATENVTLYAKWQFVCESDKWFHIGEDRMCLYSNKETDKTINFNIDGEVYYLLMSIDPDLRINATSTKKLRMLQNGIIYNGYDWSAK